MQFDPDIQMSPYSQLPQVANSSNQHRQNNRMSINSHVSSVQSEHNQNYKK